MSNTQPPFEWTESKLLDFFEFATPFNRGQISSRLKEFKASSHTHKGDGGDWEIVSFFDRGDFATPIRSKNDPYWPKSEYGGGFTEKEMLSCNRYTIYSVKRLSDGEVFTVGNTVSSKHKDRVTISGFHIENDKMMVCFEGIQIPCEIYWIAKASHIYREPLFITEDGKEILDEHTLVWVVNTAWALMCRSATQKLLWDEQKDLDGCFKYFSTENVAKNYILMNRPCLSIVEIIRQSEWYSGNDETVCFKFKKADLIALAQSKTNITP